MLQRLVGLIAAVALNVTTASAAVTTMFEYDGQTIVDGAVTTFGPGFPPGGVFRDSNSGLSSVAAITGDGADNPVFTFSNSAASVGEASALSNTKVTVDITNDSAFARTASWNFLIFAGGAGIITPDLGPDCALPNLDECETYLAPFSSHGASASLQFGASLDGVELYSGDIFVDDSTQTSSFNMIALQNFGALPGNNQYFRWEETSFSRDLGEFAPGESKTLEFFVVSSVISSGQDGCFRSDEFFFCTGAQAGFGDPDGMNGGIIPFAFSFSGPLGGSVVFDPVPIPGAVWLFLTALGAGAGARRIRQKGARK